MVCYNVFPHMKCQYGDTPHTRTDAHIHTHAHVHAYTWGAHTCMYMPMSAYTHTCTNRQTDRKTRMHAHTCTYTHSHTVHTCILGPQISIAMTISEPMACTMLLNYSVSMFAISRAFVISSSFCSPTYLVSASLALVNLYSDCYISR